MKYLEKTEKTKIILMPSIERIIIDDYKNTIERILGIFISENIWRDYDYQNKMLIFRINGLKFEISPSEFKKGKFNNRKGRIYFFDIPLSFSEYNSFWTLPHTMKYFEFIIEEAISRWEAEVEMEKGAKR